MNNGLIMMSGLPCSGKTFLAESIIPDGVEYLSTDKIRMRTGCVNPFDDPSRSTVYQLLFNEAEARLRSGTDVLLDATFSKRSRRGEVYKICKRMRASLIVLSLRCSHSVLRERMGTRMRARDTMPALRIDTLDLVTSEYEDVLAGELKGIGDVALIKVYTDSNSAGEVLRKGCPKFVSDIERALGGFYNSGFDTA